MPPSSPPGSARLRRPGRRQRREAPTQFTHRLLCDAAVGGELAPIHRQDGCLILCVVELQQIVARDPRRVGAAVVMKCAHTGIGPDEIALGNRLGQEAVHRPAQIHHLVLRDGNTARITRQHDIRRADQCELAFERDDEDDAAVVVRQHQGAARRQPAPNHHMTALDQSSCNDCGERRAVAQEALHPGPCSVHDSASADFHLPRVARNELRRPTVALRDRANAARPRHHDGAARCRIDGVGHHQARIVGPAVVVAETGSALRLEKLAFGRTGEIQRPAARKVAAPGQPVVQEQACADLPRRAGRGRAREKERQRPTPDAARCASTSRARAAPRAPGGNHPARGSAVRRERACWMPTTSLPRDHPLRRGARAARGRRHRALCLRHGSHHRLRADRPRACPPGHSGTASKALPLRGVRPKAWNAEDAEKRLAA